MILYEVLRCEQLLNYSRWCEDENQWNKCNILKSTIMVILKWKLPQNLCNIMKEFPQKWKTEAMISCHVWSLRVDPTLCPFRRWKSTVFELMSRKSPFRMGRFKLEPLYDLFWVVATPIFFIFTPKIGEDELIFWVCFAYFSVDLHSFFRRERTSISFFFRLKKNKHMTNSIFFNQIAQMNCFFKNFFKGSRILSSLRKGYRICFHLRFTPHFDL